MSAIDDFNYHMDPRSIAGSLTKPVAQELPGGKLVVSITLEDDDDEERIIELPGRFEVCGLCNGRGMHVNPSIDSGGLSREDFDDDPGFEEDYFSGAYDVTCESCGGKRVSIVIDRAKLTKAHAEDLKAFEDHQAEEYAYARECAYERAMGC